MPLKKFLLTAAVAGLFAVALFAAVATWFGLSFGAANPAGPSKYSAVYLSTGDIYYGALSWFPSPRLAGAWLLQRGVDKNNQPQLAVVPFANAFWGPVGDVYLNPKEIIFWTKLRNDSQIVKLIENPNSLQQQPLAETPKEPVAPPLKK